MNSRKYKKMDKFVNEMNQSVTIVGDMSIYLFNRFRNFVGYLFIAITTVAISFIIAEFINSFQFAPIAGMDSYFIALFSSLVIGLYIAFYGEEAKIATIKGAIFSSGSNRSWQAGAALSIIVVLIIVNAKGVQRLADFSLRYMDKELQQSVVFKLKEKKIHSHTLLASSKLDTKMQNRAIKALFQTRENYENAKQREIASVQSAYASLIAGKDTLKYRSYIARKKLENGRKIAQIESSWDRKIAQIDNKISHAQDKLNSQISQANQIKQSQIKEADRATDDLISHYKHVSNSNRILIDEYKNIGLIVAVGGEIIDGLLAFLLFMIVKSNPNVNATPTVQKNTRKLVKLKSYEREDGGKKAPTPSLDKAPNKSENFSFQTPTPDTLDEKLFTKIKKVASVMAKENDDFIKVGMNMYLKHPSQRDIIKAFGEYGIKLTPYHVREYFTQMEDEIMFVNQKIGFVYTHIVKKVAA